MRQRPLPGFVPGEWKRFSLPAIVGVTDEANVASQRVLIRCGFSRKEEKLMRFQGVDRPVVVFELSGAMSDFLKSVQ